jgi:hypothetical protein
MCETLLGKRFSAAETIPEANLEDLREFGRLASLELMTTSESELLIAGIIPLEPTTAKETARIRTYATLLGLAQHHNQSPKEADFFSETLLLKRHLPSQFHAHLDSWLRHLTRDALAVGHEYVLQEAVDVLGDLSHGKLMIANTHVVEHLCRDSVASDTALRELGLLEDGEEAQSLPFAEMFARLQSLVEQDSVIESGLRRWSSTITELKLISMIRNDRAIAVTLLPIVWCVAMLRAEAWPESDTNPFEGRPGFGWDLIGVHAVIIPEIRRYVSEDLPVLEVMKELAMRTVDQHLRVSWSRMAVDSQHDVALLIADGEEWQSRNEKHVQEYTAGRTDSRIGQAIKWLRQLNLIGDEGLTPRGAELYVKLCAGSPTPVGAK